MSMKYSPTLWYQSKKKKIPSTVRFNKISNCTFPTKLLPTLINSPISLAIVPLSNLFLPPFQRVQCVFMVIRAETTPPSFQDLFNTSTTFSFFLFNDPLIIIYAFNQVWQIIISYQDWIGIEDISHQHIVGCDCAAQQWSPRERRPRLLLLQAVVPFLNLIPAAYNWVKCIFHSLNCSCPVPSGRVLVWFSLVLVPE